MAASYHEHVLSFTAIGMGLAGFGLEGPGDIKHGSSWHVGVLALPNIAAMLFHGREREFLGTWAFPSVAAPVGSITDSDYA